MVAMDRRSLTYEARLFKYSKRRFAAAVPNFDRTQVDPQLFMKTLRQVQGLGKLLLLEYRQLYGTKKLPVEIQEEEEQPSFAFGRKKSRRSRRRRPRRERKPKENMKQKIHKLREMEKEGLDPEDLEIEVDGAPPVSDDETVLDESDYTDVHIPWYIQKIFFSVTSSKGVQDGFPPKLWRCYPSKTKHSSSTKRVRESSIDIFSYLE